METHKNISPQVTVIMPVYQTGLYLEEALQSVLSQSLNDLEVICVDDGSTDSSYSILSSHAKNDARVKVLQTEHMGVSAARNKGLSLASGQYVYFMDSDDVLKETALEEMLLEAKSTRAEIVVCNAEVFYDQNCTDEQLRYKPNYSRSGLYTGVIAGQDMFCEMFRNNEYYVPVWLYLFSIPFLRTNELLFFPGIYHEDELFLFNAMITAQRVTYLDKAFYRRRVRPGSIMTSNNGVINSYSYYIVAKEILSLLNKFNNHLSLDTISCANKLAENKLNRSVSLYNQIPESEKELNDNTYSDPIFKMAICDYVSYSKARDLCSELDRSLSKSKQREKDLIKKLNESEQDNKCLLLKLCEYKKREQEQLSGISELEQKEQELLGEIFKSGQREKKLLSELNVLKQKNKEQLAMITESAQIEKEMKQKIEDIELSFCSEQKEKEKAQERLKEITNSRLYKILVWLRKIKNRFVLSRKLSL